MPPVWNTSSKALTCRYQRRSTDGSWKLCTQRRWRRQRSRIHRLESSVQDPLLSTSERRRPYPDVLGGPSANFGPATVNTCCRTGPDSNQTKSRHVPSAIQPPTRLPTCSSAPQTPLTSPSLPFGQTRWKPPVSLTWPGYTPQCSAPARGNYNYNNLHPMFIKSRGIFFRLVSNYEVFLFVRIKLGLSADSDYHLMSGSSFRDAGHRSPYLSNAKRALYHLSYIPTV